MMLRWTVIIVAIGYAVKSVLEADQRFVELIGALC
jgi:hypothetical protein